ncbi:hypothetical protein ASF23_12680 [Curtobacterium sp. Leaf261]|nr:hypothetical protein ASF23_12680 [Curtobacterium sp. Leaf261]
MSKNARREAARQAARARQEQERRRQRRNRWFLQGGIGLAVIAVAVVVVVVVSNMNSSSGTTTAAGPKNMASDGITFTGESGKIVATPTDSLAPKATPSPAATSASDGAVVVTTYIDWSCPSCKAFEAQYSSELQSQVRDGSVVLDIHPIAILDRNYRNSRYSSRAANAAACVANTAPKDFLAVQTQFYDNQPEEGTDGLTDAKIKSLVKAGGVSSAKVADCIDSEKYGSWVTAATNRAVGNEALQNPATGSFGTPTVLIDGKVWDQKSSLTSAIAAAAK